MKDKFVIKNNRKVLLLIMIVIIILIISANLIIKRGTFEQLIFDKLSNTNFELIDISKKDMNTTSRAQIYIKNSLNIDELTNMLSKLKLLEVKSIPEEDFIENSYYMDIITVENEGIYLKFYQPSKYITLGVDGKANDMEKMFKIINGEIDYLLLNKLITNQNN